MYAPAAASNTQPWSNANKKEVYVCKEHWGDMSSFERPFSGTIFRAIFSGYFLSTE
jgi:hypothetical protein